MCKKIIFIFLLLAAAFSLNAKIDKFKTGELPKNILIISQSSDFDETLITAIDLDNNELVIISTSGGGSYECFRTGIICDPNKQNLVKGESSPLKTRN